MKTKFDADELNLISLAKKYSNENRARKLFEAWRWPGGKPICPHCKHDKAYAMKSNDTSKTDLYGLKQDFADIIHYSIVVGIAVIVGFLASYRKR